MMGNDEQQLVSEVPQMSESADNTNAGQPDDAGRKPRKRTSKQARTEEPAPRKIKRHTAAERAEKLQRIEEALANGGVSLKAAVEAVGVSDQTYYQWKRADKPADVAPTSTASPSSAPAAPPSLGNELAELIKLEEENQRLRQLLGEKLRAENAELRRRLEMN
ncbi:transposase [Rhizobium sp. NFR03]|uniref:transposase n=1 Tax=Rhizobium sp. NFR03 TaxID=1566263 RepID=UPI0008C4BA1E|nr:transposase [Rhizobium sp. NFR03]SES39317.1 putative transposase [Rhizobium sp. NFR03]